MVSVLHWHESATGVHMSRILDPLPHLPPHPIPLGWPRALALCALSHALNLDWASTSHMVTYMFQCCSLKSSHLHLPLLLLHCLQVSCSHVLSSLRPSVISLLPPSIAYPQSSVLFHPPEHFLQPAIWLIYVSAIAAAFLQRNRTYRMWYTHTYIYIHTNACLCAYIHIYVCVCIYIYIYIYSGYVFLYAYMLSK